MALDAAIKRVDRYQQKHSWLAFPIAVYKKYGDDDGGDQAALLTYYAFLSLFPLLLVLVSIAEIISKRYPGIGNGLIDSAFNYFPVLGTQLQENIHAPHRSGIGLLVGTLIILIGARGVAFGIQAVANNIWGIPRDERSNFLKKTLRSMGLIFIGGGGLVITSAMVSYLYHWSGMSAKILALSISLILNFGAFLVIYRMCVSRQVKTHDLLRGTLVMTLAWQILQSLGSFIILDKLRGFSTIYGVFALVLGLLFWISIQAQVILYAMEIDVVHAKKLWPRSLVSPTETTADKRVTGSYAETEKRAKKEEVNVRFQK